MLSFDLVNDDHRFVLGVSQKSVRDALCCWFGLDEKCGAIIASTREDQLALIKLAWWRDAIVNLDNKPAVNEPLLSGLVQIDPIYRPDASQFEQLIESWSLIMRDFPFDRQCLQQFGMERGSTFFSGAAKIIGTNHDMLAIAGACWALTDLACHLSDKKSADLAHQLATEYASGVDIKSWPSALRPLAILFLFARHDLAHYLAKPKPHAIQRKIRAYLYLLTGR